MDQSRLTRCSYRLNGEEALFVESLASSARELGASDPFVKAAPGGRSPEEVAHEVTAGTRMAHPAIIGQVMRELITPAVSPKSWKARGNGGPLHLTARMRISRSRVVVRFARESKLNHYSQPPSGQPFVSLGFPKELDSPLCCHILNSRYVL